MLVKLFPDFRQKKYVQCVTKLLNFYLMKTCDVTFLSNLVNPQKKLIESFYYEHCLLIAISPLLVILTFTSYYI